MTIYLRPEEVGKVRFNRHHRRPRCQGGGNGPNTTRVDLPSHGAFNQLVSLSAKLFGIEERRVKTRHIAKVINLFNRIGGRLFADPVTRTLKPVEQIAKEFNEIWLPQDDGLVLTVEGGVHESKLRD